MKSRRVVAVGGLFAALVLPHCATADEPQKLGTAQAITSGDPASDPTLDLLTAACEQEVAEFWERYRAAAKKLAADTFSRVADFFWLEVDLHGSVVGPPVFTRDAAESASLSEDQVAWYFTKHADGFGLPALGQLSEVTVERLSHAEEPWEHRPLIGQSILHRRIYRCRVTGVASEKVFERHFNLEQTFYERITPPKKGGAANGTGTINKRTGVIDW